MILRSPRLEPRLSLPRSRGARLVLVLAGLAAQAIGVAPSQTTSDAPASRPEAIINLATSEGVRLVKGQWRYSDTKIVEIEHHAPGADLKPSGPPNRTYDVVPHAGALDFDDSKWEALDPPALDARRSTGRLCFNWYRIKLTIPSSIGRFDPTGSTAVFEVVVDDYAEVWVDGRLPQVLGQAGGPLVKGFNAPNRVVAGRDLRPGQQIQIAVFGMNGPISSPPGNFIWIRSATLDFFRQAPPGALQDAGGRVARLDPALDAIVPADAKIEKVAGGFLFTEGPVWVRDGGYLLFSDLNNNTIYRWTPDGQVSVVRT